MGRKYLIQQWNYLLLILHLHIVLLNVLQVLLLFFSDTPLPQLPQGMRNRSKGYPAQLAVIRKQN